MVCMKKKHITTDINSLALALGDVLEHLERGENVELKRTKDGQITCLMVKKKRLFVLE